MPAFNLTADRALDLWRTHGPSYDARIGQYVGVIPTAAIVDWLVGEMVQLALREAPRAWAWFSRQAVAIAARLEAAADRLDARLRWHNIANEDLRDLFEANDDLYEVFRGGLRALLQTIEADVAEAETRQGLQLLEGDAFAGFFRRAPLSPEVKGRLLVRGAEAPEPAVGAPPVPEPVPVDSMAEAKALKLRQELDAERAAVEQERAERLRLAELLRKNGIDPTAPATPAIGEVPLPTSPEDVPPSLGLAARIRQQLDTLERKVDASPPAGTSMRLPSDTTIRIED